MPLVAKLAISSCVLLARPNTPQKVILSPIIHYYKKISRLGFSPAASWSSGKMTGFQPVDVGSIPTEANNP